MNKLLLLLLLSMSIGLFAQSDPPSVTSTYLIKNGWVTTRPGTAPAKTSILIKDGIITSVGANLQAPYDAEVIDADSSYVYASFIAGLSHIGIDKKEESNERPKVDRPGYPPNDVAGITPEVSVSDVFNKGESSIKDFREAGFAIAHTVPEGRMLPGQGSIVSLNGKDYYGAVIAQDVSQFAQFRGGQRVFPATTIGVTAKWRELYKNAELASAHSKAYAQNAANKTRPNADAATEALFPVVARNQSVFFLTEEHLDIYRALQLSGELGFNIVLSEVKSGNDAINKIKSSGAKVLLSADLPDKLKEDKKKDKDKDKKEESDPQEEALLAKKQEAIDKHVAQAKMFSDAGVPFAFSVLETKAKDINEAVMRMIESGLAYDKALAALTTDAAKMLNIQNRAGTIEAGKMANIIIATDSLFTKDSKIKMVIVDGMPHKIDVKEKKKSSGDAVDAEALVGTWSYTIEVPGMTPSGELKITKDGDDVKIEISSNQAPGEFMDAENVDIDGSSVSFGYTIQIQGTNVTILNDITFDGDSFDGSVDVGDFGSFPITGEKISSPE